MSIQIRDLIVNDIEEILSLFHSYLDTGLPRERIQYLIEHYPSKCALINNKIIGFCYTSDFSLDILCIANIFVSVAERNRGVGEKILLAILDEARNRMFKAAILVNSSLYITKKEKKDPTSFYIRLGFHMMHNTGDSSVYLKKIESND